MAKEQDIAIGIASPDPDISELVKISVEDQGYKTHILNYYQIPIEDEFEKAVRASNAKALIVDLGWPLSQRVREMDALRHFSLRNKNIRLIYLIAEDPKNMRNFDNEHITGFLVKPFELDDLYKLLEQCKQSPHKS